MPLPAPAGVKATVMAVEAVAEEEAAGAVAVESAGLFISGSDFALNIHTSVCQSR